MTNFEFVFSLFGLLLGLSLAEVLGGLTRALKSRHRVAIGVLTPLLGLFVCFDLTSFWASAWTLRDAIPAGWPTLFFGFVVSGIYYVAATLVFPDDPGEWESYDAYYFAHKKQVLGAVLACNLLMMAGQMAMTGFVPGENPRDWLFLYGFFLLMVAAILVRGRRWNLALLGAIIALYPLAALVGLWLPK